MEKVWKGMYQKMLLDCAREELYEFSTFSNSASEYPFPHSLTKYFQWF